MTYLVILIEAIRTDCILIDLIAVAFTTITLQLLLSLTLFVALLGPIHTATISEGLLVPSLFSSLGFLVFPDVARRSCFTILI